MIQSNKNVQRNRVVESGKIGKLGTGVSTLYEDFETDMAENLNWATSGSQNNFGGRHGRSRNADSEAVHRTTPVVISSHLASTNFGQNEMGPNEDSFQQRRMTVVKKLQNDKATGIGK